MLNNYLFFFLYMHANIYGRNKLIVFYEITKRKRFWLLEIINLICHYARPIFMETKKLLLFLFFLDHNLY